MLNNLRNQLLLICAVLIAVILGQAYVTLKNQSALTSQVGSFEKLGTSLSRVHELERDVLDLQRTVFSFRQTGSPAMVSRFGRLKDRIVSNIELLSNTIGNIEVIQEKKLFERMLGHINSYEESFVQVVKNRQKTNNLLNDQLLESLSSLQRLYQSDLELSLSLSRAGDNLKAYQLSPDNVFIDKFIEEVDALSSSELFTSTKPAIDELVTQFNVYTQFVNSNLFLTNVVMAGSANEFLYLSGALVDLVQQDTTKQKQVIAQQAEITRLNSQIFSVLGMLTVCLLIIVFAWRLLAPITSLTNVFKTLAGGGKVDDIPGHERGDEIGMLASAADVFNTTNQRTQTLLDDAQALNGRLTQLNSELKDSKREAERATALKSRFLANMSHEIRTPINGITGLVELLQRHDIPPISRKYIDKIAHSSRTLLSVINDVLDFSKIEAGKLDIVKEPFSMQSVFENILSVVGVRAEQKNLTVRCYADPKIPPQLIGDPMRITQVLINLSNNAIKFTHKGEVSLRFTGEASDVKQRYTLRVSVIDTGIGMTPAQLDNVFQPFIQADDASNRRYGGTGLGLAIVKQLTDLMGGEVKALSAVNEGSTFSVSFDLGLVAGIPFQLLNFTQVPDELVYFTDNPLVDKQLLQACNVTHLSSVQGIEDLHVFPKFALIDMEDFHDFKQYDQAIRHLMDRGCKLGIVFHQLNSQLAEKVTLQQPNPILIHPYSPFEFNRFLLELLGVENAHRRKLDKTLENITLDAHILLVEDNEINQLVAGDMLASLGATYDIAENGQVAVQKLTAADDYDLVLMDVQMPIMDGLEATRTLRKQGFTKPIIGLSANAMDQDKEVAEATGMDDYLTKPISRTALVSRVVKHLNGA